MEKIETNQKSPMAVSTPTERGPTLTDVPSSAVTSWTATGHSSGTSVRCWSPYGSA